MNYEHQTKKFYEIGSISYLEGRKDIASLFKQEAEKISQKQKYNQRKRILGMRFFQNIQSLKGDIQVTHKHTVYKYDYAEQAVILKGCKNYHPYHIDYIAQNICQNGRFCCIEQGCQALCLQTLDIKLNAFVASYFENVKHFQNATLVFKRENIGSIQISKKQSILSESKDKSNQTIIDLIDNPGCYSVITIEVLQLDVNDQRVKLLDTHQLIDKIKNLEEKGNYFYENQLSSSNGQILMNLICFKTFVRIRNPLIHKDCRPSDHNNRLVAFSFEQIYSQLINRIIQSQPRLKMASSKKKKSKAQQYRIKCIFPGCNNYFSASNFDEVAIIIPKVREQVYREDKQCIFGQFCGGVYNRNWFSNLQLTSVTQLYKNNNVSQIYKTIKENIQSLLATTNLEKNKRRKIYKLLKKDISSIQNQDIATDFKGKVLKVNLGQRNLCPVRCYKCKTLNSIDAFTLSFHLQPSNQISCRLCYSNPDKNKSKETPKRFYQKFKLDLDLLEFIFINGYNKQVYYDVQQQKYFHKMSFFTGKTLRENALLQDRIYNKNIYTAPINIKLDKKKKYIPFISSQCSSESLPEHLNLHIFFIQQKQRFHDSLQYSNGIQKIADSNLKCGYCKAILRSDKIQYCQDLQRQLVKANNQLKWDGKNQNSSGYKKIGIQSINYYLDIRNLSKLPSNSPIEIYWRNQMGFLIKYPFKFKGCTHSFSSTICDFTDLIYQKRVKNQTKFKCRYKPCQKEYSQLDDLERVPLQIYKHLQEKHLIETVIKEGTYCLIYDIDNRKILERKRSFQNKISINQQRDIQFYKNIYDDLVLNKKEVLYSLAQISQTLKIQSQKVNEDIMHFKTYKKYYHSNSEEQFTSATIKRENLIRQKQKLSASLQKIEQQQNKLNRKQNRTYNINFRKLAQIYPNQTAKLNNNREKVIQRGAQKIQSDNYETMGNIGTFKYKVPHQKQQLTVRQHEQLEKLILLNQSMK